jgi:hypothetical protein
MERIPLENVHKEKGKQGGEHHTDRSESQKLPNISTDTR